MQAGTAGEAILETRGLTKDFKGFTAVDGVDLRVRRGSVHALIGPNGAGKTTCFNLLTKFLTPTKGAILYEGRDITRLKPSEIARRGMVRSFQISAVFPHLTALDNVKIALERARGGDGYAFWTSQAAMDGLDGEAHALLDSVGLADAAHATAAELSYGRKRALEIATTLALDPKLLLLDEPTAGMAEADVARVTDLIGRVAASRTVLMVEHNLSVVSTLCDTITVLARGQVLAQGDYATVSADPRVIEAYIGTEAH